MAEITRIANRAGSLLASTNRVEAPFVRVSIGGYTFGVMEKKSKSINKATGVVKDTTTKYPNFIKDLRVNKINGTVNTYTLNIKYTITENSDPNFFEKLFSSVSDTFRIKFTYGDAMQPNYIYREEEAIITDIQNSFDIQTPCIDYTIKAVSTSSLSLSGVYTFPTVRAKPSDVIKRVLYNSKYHLTDVFTGMRDRSLVESMNFIASDDRIVQIPTCTNMSILEYVTFLVTYMNPTGSTTSSAIKALFPSQVDENSDGSR